MTFIYNNGFKFFLLKKEGKRLPLYEKGKNLKKHLDETG